MKKNVIFLILLLAIAASLFACPSEKPPEIYTITYRLDGGTNNAANPDTYTSESETITLKDPVKAGHTFAGWAEGSTIPAGSAGNKTFTAQWAAAIKKATVTYDYQKADQNAPASISVTYGQSYTLAVPVRAGYTFDGWYGAAGGNGVKYTGPDAVSLSAWQEDGDKTLYASWLGTPGLSYSEINGGAGYSVSKGTADTNSNIYIPEYYCGKPVSMLSHYAFKDCYYLPGIKIPDSVTYFGDMALYGCNRLTGIILPENLTSVGYAALSGCSGLTKLNLPGGLADIGQYAFNSCHGLTEITIGAGNTVYRAEGNCLIKISTGVLMLGCKNSVIPGGVTEIGASAFANCFDLASVTIPDSVTVIGNNAFSWCQGLTSVTIPGSVTRIAGDAFAYCSGLTGLAIPKSVTEIGAFTFAGCSGLTSITVAAENPVYRSEGNCLIQKNGNVLILGCKNSIIPGGVAEIGDYAFFMCKSLTGIIIPDTVTKIGKSAFSNCFGLTNITIPGAVSAIGDNAFSYCFNLTTVTVERSMAAGGPAAFGAGVFDVCSLLTDIFVPAGSVAAYRTAWPAYAGKISAN